MKPTNTRLLPDFISTAFIRLIRSLKTKAPSLIASIASPTIRRIVREELAEAGLRANAQMNEFLIATQGKGDPMMKPDDAKLVAGFLLQEFERFAEYLDGCDIEPTEASMIIENIISESGGGVPTCIEQFSGFIGE